MEDLMPELMERGLATQLLYIDAENHEAYALEIEYIMEMGFAAMVNLLKEGG
jgi:hypothetical protein